MKIDMYEEIIKEGIHAFACEFREQLDSVGLHYTDVDLEEEVWDNRFKAWLAKNPSGY